MWNGEDAADSHYFGARQDAFGSDSVLPAAYPLRKRRQSGLAYQRGECGPQQLARTLPTRLKQTQAGTGNTFRVPAFVFLDQETYKEL